jgi:uncharacterized membrane protein YphA (DoxX/SURF4 family)
MAELFLLGRLIFGGYFLYNGANHFLSNAALAQYAASKGVPNPEIAVALSGLLLIAGGLSVLLGAWPRLGALCIIVFLAIVTPTMHNFWAVSDPAMRMADMIHFTKDAALLGASLLMLGIERPWPYSLEQRRTIAG